jgi:DHA1 family tetracycline resistance protein-like MFS transporter
MVGSHRKASVAFIMIVLVLDTLGIGLVSPVLPRLIESLTHSDVASASRTLGLYISTYAAMQFVFSPIIGGLSDRYGRRVVLLTSLLGAVGDYVMLTFAPTLGWLFVARVFGGMTGASVSTAVAYMTDVTPPEKRAGTFGLIGAAFGFGFIVGPGLGGLLGGLHLRAPFMAALVLNLVSLIYGIFVLPESLSEENRRPFSWKRANPIGAMRSLARSPIILALTATIVCVYLAEQTFHSTWALFTELRFGWAPMGVGLSLVALGASTSVVQAWLLEKIVARFGDRTTILLGLLARGASYVVFGVVNSASLFFASIFPYALGGIVEPSVRGLLTNEVSASEQGELQGSVNSVMSLMSIIGPLFGTAVFATFAPETASPRIVGATAIVAAALTVVAVLCVARVFALRKPAEAPAK